MFCALHRRLFWRDPKPVRAVDRPKQNPRSPLGGGEDPKQCPGDAQSDGLEVREGKAVVETFCADHIHGLG